MLLALTVAIPLKRTRLIRAKSLRGPPAAGSIMMYTVCFHSKAGGIMLIN
jgi:hypothetical protein